MTCGLPWVKISKVMLQSKSVSPGKGGKPHGKKSKSFGKNMVRFNRTHLFLNFFQIYVLYFGKISSKLCKFHAIRPQNPTNHTKFTPFTDTLYIMFQMPAPTENSQKFQ